MPHHAVRGLLPRRAAPQVLHEAAPIRNLGVHPSKHGARSGSSRQRLEYQPRACHLSLGHSCRDLLGRKQAGRQSLREVQVRRAEDGHSVSRGPARGNLGPMGTYRDLGPVRCFSKNATLQNCWPQLKDGTMVACRSRERDPNNLYRCGDAHPMTCGRATYAHQLRTGCWRRAQGSREWICPACYMKQQSCQLTFDE